MSGHSKWATIKRQKAVTDAKRGAIFTKLANAITVAAREKGGGINSNFNLRMAVEQAKAFNMPKENIERAIKRGIGELAGERIEELIYEGFGPAKSQFIIKSLTDNKNRSAASIRHLFIKYGGNLGSVIWNFEKKGVLRIKKEVLSKENFEDLELSLIDAGVQDIFSEPEGITLYTKVEDLQKVKNFLEERDLRTETTEIEFVAKTLQEVSGSEKEQIEKFVQELEENEDVTDYYTNINI